MSSSFGKISIFSGNQSVTLLARSGLAASYNLLFPNAAPANNQVLRWDSTAGSFVWSAANSTTITSGNTATFTAANDGQGNYTLGFPSQSAALFLASPSGGAGVPTFRAIANADITSLDSAKLTGTVAPARMPSGTDASSWQIGTAALNPKIVASSTSVLEFRKNDNTLADAVFGNITATGTVNFTTVNTVQVGDSILDLNSDYSGATPTEDAGINVNRGSLTGAQLLWQESTDRWVAGLSTALYQLALKVTRNIVAADVVSNLVTWTHNLGTTAVMVQIRDANGVSIGVDSTITNSNTVTIDFTGLTVTGTWTAVIVA